ncbi:SMI1/KNR4 family protein [Kosakonia sacchari]|uniref:SMI1/KNR4 family protein n=1 Tax=Kosakonia sacchari TaxID=1158459 RepID=UPI0032D9471D
MTVKLINSSPSLSADELQRVQASLGISFPGVLKAMWLAHNGGELEEERRVYQNDKYEFDIKYFLPILHTRSEGIITVEWLYKTLVNEKKILPARMIPFAINGGGFPFCINTDDEAIYFANLENQKDIYLDPDFDSFINCIVTEDEAWG